ncbi:MAG: hypothetical protein LQ342_002161 [Letrouitia transgressa]|nr:MAG: hypothetical protein LQ342_002161 [Letrouitia transgressa]
MGLGPKDYQHEVTTPTTPRAPAPAPSQPPPTSRIEDQGPATPTRLSFGGMSGQRPLPGSPFRPSFNSSSQSTDASRPSLPSRESSQRSNRSQDIDMDESEEGEGDGGSDEESVDAETGRPLKKKKGQRFFCTEFPPCNLSFTRSEHLARHIRKHTGERPFQCHCSRRFSRLDNLRQHAQTVHVNEEIPGDSLAATGTRFQRQIRTDRVRTPTGRSRASTAGSQGNHGRGHSRNLSASSIGSAASTISRGDDNRRRPAPLLVTNDMNGRNRPTIDTKRSHPTTPPGQYSASKESSEGLNTPTSTFSNGASSPGYGSTFGSPVSSHSRVGSFYGGAGYHGRRLSVPSGPNPFQSPQSNSYQPPYFSPLTPSTASIMSSNSSAVGSPTTSTYSSARRDSALAEEAWRRRTWHPSTYNNYSRPATSGLSFYQTPDDAPRPAFAPQAATATPFPSVPQRLPGIEAFDQMTNRRQPDSHRSGSPMQVDSPAKPPIYPGPSVQSTSGPNKGHASWDMSLHQNLTKLDIASGTPPRDGGMWSQQPPSDFHNVNGKPPDNPAQTAPQAQAPPVVVHQEHPKRIHEGSGSQQGTSYRAKRLGWYNGPLTAPQNTTQPRTSPEGSSSSESVPTPLHSTAEYHPSIVHSNGHLEGHHPAQSNGYNQAAPSHGYPYTSDPNSTAGLQPHDPKEKGMSGLEVLVAVATSEDKATTNGGN